MPLSNSTNAEASLHGMVWGKLHCRKDESLRLLWAPPLPGT